MAKKTLKTVMHSYGIYESWKGKEGGIPKVKKHTKEIPVELDSEFGYVLKITGGKGQRIDFLMEHPPFKDNKGNVAAPFRGQEYIKNNEFFFFLGDTFWEPIEDKRGIWRLITEIKGQRVADMSFTMI